MTEPPRRLQVGDVVRASVRGSYYKWIVREVKGDIALASAPGLGCVRFEWYGPLHTQASNRSGYGHGLKFYFVRHEQ